MFECLLCAGNWPARRQSVNRLRSLFPRTVSANIQARLGIPLGSGAVFRAANRFKANLSSTSLTASSYGQACDISGPPTATGPSGVEGHRFPMTITTISGSGVSVSSRTHGRSFLSTICMGAPWLGAPLLQSIRESRQVSRFTVRNGNLKRHSRVTVCPVCFLQLLRTGSLTSASTGVLASGSQTIYAQLRDMVGPPIWLCPFAGSYSWRGDVTDRGHVRTEPGSPFLKVWGRAFYGGSGIVHDGIGDEHVSIEPL